MKNQASFSSKDKSKKLKCRLLQFLFVAIRVKPNLEEQWLLSLSKTKINSMALLDTLLPC